MQSVVQSTLSVLIALFPIALIAALLQLSTWRQRARLAAVSRQIAVTDAIHAVLGAVVSPVVRRRLWRGWQLTIPVRHAPPPTVMQVLPGAYGPFGPADPT